MFVRNTLKMNKFRITVLLLFTTLVLRAQQVVSTDELQDLLNSASLQLENPDVRNFSLIRQIDQTNSISVIQNQQGSLQNTVLVNQDGQLNAGYIEQNGYSLQTQLWQFGSGNEASLWSEGNHINMEVKQDGNDNTINSFIENYVLVSRSAYLLQQGNNNRIELALFGDAVPTLSNAQELQISQTGNNHSLQANLENTFESFTVTQTAGINGEGMQVNISNSAFSFPMKK